MNMEKRNYMIVDGDTHISFEPKDKAVTAEELISRMDEAGVDKALSTLQCGIDVDEECDYEGLNKYVYEETKKYSDRLIPLGWVNPRLWPARESIRQLHIQVEDYGFKAIKLNGMENYFDLLDTERSIPIIEELAKTGTMVAFHCGNDDRTNPKKVAVIAKMYPELPVLLIHMGITLNDDAIRAAEANKNITLIGSNLQDYSYVRKAIDILGSRRVCFGSDAPFFDLSECIQTYDTILAGLSEDEIRNVMGKNILRLFGEV